MNIRKNIVQVFSANLIQLIVGVVVTFFVPTVVSIDNYADIKTYTLYVSYIGILSLGIYDGIYIIYGGKDIELIDKDELGKIHWSFVLVQLLGTIAMFSFGLAIKHPIVTLFGLSILPANLFTYFKRLFQSTGRFNYFRDGVLLYSISYMILNLFFAVITKVNAVIPYCIAAIIANIIACIYSELVYHKVVGFSNIYFSKILTIDTIKAGYLILCGNIAVGAIYSLDRWCVKLLFTNTDFAYYSFATSLLNIVMVLVQSIAITLYNYFAAEKNYIVAKRTNSLVIVIGALVSAAYFILCSIVEYIIPKYTPSLEIIAISFASYPYMISINSVFLNLYKSNKRDKAYIKSVLFMIVVCILTNVIACFTKQTVSIAFATTLSFIVWYIFCQLDFKKVLYNKGEAFYLIVMTIVFLLLSETVGGIYGLAIYLIAWLGASLLFLKKCNIKIKSLI